MLWEYEFLRNLNTAISSDVLDKIMVFFTRLADHGEIWIFIGLVFLIKKSTRKMGISVLVALGIGYLLGNMLLKELIARPRPFNAYDISLIIPPPTDYSFPSGHTLASFESAFVVWFQNKRIGTVFLLLALVIAFSRLYLMVHYPTDILAGFVLALGVAGIAYYITNKNWGHIDIQNGKK